MKILLLSLFLSLFSLSFGQSMSKNMQKGVESFFSADFQTAIKYFQKELRKNPSNEANFWIGHSYSQMNEYQQAKPYYKAVIESKVFGSPYIMSVINLGNCYAAEEMHDSAIFYYDLAIEDYPEEPSPFYNKGLVLDIQGKFEESHLCYDQVLALEPTNWEALHKRLETSFAMLDFESGLADLLKVREINPEFDINVNLAFVYTMLAKYDEADSIYQEIYDETDPVILNNYGFNKHMIGKSEEAKTIINKSLKIDPENSYAYRNLAIISIAELDMEKACEHLHNAEKFQYLLLYGSEVKDLIEMHCD